MNGEPMKKKHFNPLPQEIQAEIDLLAALPEDQIQTDDLPEVRDWNDARRGIFYRPIEEEITLHLDADIIDWFKNHHLENEGYRMSINRALREYIGQRN
jgi:uncharacterized protein (DUF4415 family)